LNMKASQERRAPSAVEERTCAPPPKVAEAELNQPATTTAESRAAGSVSATALLTTLLFTAVLLIVHSGVPSEFTCRARADRKRGSVRAGPK